MGRPLIRVLIVEDHVGLAQNLFEFLGEERYALDFADTGLTALHLLETNRYDVIVLDVMLPGIDGFDLCRRIRQDLKCATPVILMTARDALDDKESGFAAGADDYLVKPFNLRELQLRIEALDRRGRPPSQTITAAAMSWDPATLEVSVEGAGKLELGASAASLFEVLIRSWPGYVSYERLSEVLWGRGDGDINALRTHVYTLRKSLQERYSRSLIRTVHGRGYRLDPEIPEESP